MRKNKYTFPKNTKNPRSCVVLQYDKEGNFIKEYNSMSEAARSNNTTPQSIFASIKHGWYSANSKWKYKEAIKEKDSIKDNNNINN